MQSIQIREAIPVSEIPNNFVDEKSTGDRRMKKYWGTSLREEQGCMMQEASSGNGGQDTIK